MEKEEEIKPKMCKKCGHRWSPMVKKPRECPNCKRYDWRKRAGN